MGIFSSKKIITVSSTLYNMAGDEEDRPDYLKGTVFGSIIANSPSIADDITKSYFNGPGMAQRQFFKYAKRNELTGLPICKIDLRKKLDVDAVKSEIPLSSDPEGLEMLVIEAETFSGDFQPWLEQWVFNNHPDRIDEDWIGDYNNETNEFSIEFPNNDYFSWVNDQAPVYYAGAQYILARYVEFLSASEEEVVEGTVNSGVLSLPDVTGFSEISYTPSFTPVTLSRSRTTVVSYNNGDPDETTEDGVDASVSGELNTGETVYQREIVTDSGGITVKSEVQTWNFIGADYISDGYEDVVVTTEDLGGGVTKTTTSTTTGEQVSVAWDTRYDTQTKFSGEVVGGEQTFLYGVGSGNQILDDLVTSDNPEDFQEFYPFLPVRLDNESITESIYSDLYDETETAYKRGFNNESFSELVENVEDNESIDDIDYAYIMFGVSLNVKEQKCRKYVYNFFQKLAEFQDANSENVISDFQQEIEEYEEALNEFEEWESQVENQEQELFSEVPTRPELPSISPPDTQEIRLTAEFLPNPQEEEEEDQEGIIDRIYDFLNIDTDDVSSRYDIRIQWVNISEQVFSGKYSDVLPDTDTPDKDDIIFVKGEALNWSSRSIVGGVAGIVENVVSSFKNKDNEIQRLDIYWQVSDDSYRKMTVWGMIHYNYIYGGKSVKITTDDALDDNEESGFVIPLHYPTMNEMGIVDYTQMSTANCHILFNSYQITKQRWYERGIFKVLLVIAIIVIAVVAAPGAFATGGGILGGNLAIGTALGLTGTIALVAGVVANYIASIIISQLLSLVSIELFGEKWGAVFAAIASFSVGVAMSGTSLFSVQNIFGLSNALANGYAGYMLAEANEIYADIEDEREEYEEEMERINELIASLAGNDLNFDPMFFTDSAKGNGGSSRGYLPETADQFIQRTTMTGTDLVEITLGMVHDYAEIQRTLPKN